MSCHFAGSTDEPVGPLNSSVHIGVGGVVVVGAVVVWGVVVLTVVVALWAGELGVRAGVAVAWGDVPVGSTGTGVTAVAVC